MLYSQESVLLVEDNTIDQLSLKRAVKEAGIDVSLHIVNNGEEALEYLGDPNNPKIKLIILDLNMPKMNGIEFLKAVKSDLSFKKLAVVVFSTSCEKRDVSESFANGAHGYMVKPVIFSQYAEVVKTIFSYWQFSILPE